MQNNREDKIWRDKLQSFQAEFDPAAWEQMEAMLGKDEKRKGFIWWWLAAGLLGFVLLVGGAGWLLIDKNISSLQSISDEQTHTQENNKEANDFSVLEDKSLSASNSNTTTTLQSESGSNKQQKSVAGNGSSQPSTIANATASVARRAVGIGSTTNITTSGNAGRQSAFPTFSPSSKQNAATTNEAQMIPELLEEGSSLQGNMFDEHQSDVLVTGNEILLDELQTINEATSANQDEEAIDANKETEKVGDSDIRIRYELGAAAFTGVLWAGKNPAGSVAYGAGIEQALHIGRWFALTNGIGYVRHHFNVQKPVVISYDNAPESYSSNIQQLDVSLGFRVYPVSTKRIRFYIAGSLVSHIKLKETFTYKLKDEEPLFGISTIEAEYPVQTIFTNNPQPVSERDGQDFNNNAISGSIYVSEPGNTYDFSINQARRYYFGIVAGAGVSFLLPKNLSISLEPNYYIAPQKIGVQNLRLSGLRGNFRLSYTF
jgi:hypothetical protein